VTVCNFTGCPAADHGLLSQRLADDDWTRMAA
jgi:hypothetical protein